MGTRDSRAAHGALGKTDMLLFDPERVRVVNDPKHALYDDRANEEPTEEFIENLMRFGVIEPIVFRKDSDGEPVVEDGRKRTLGLREANRRLKKKGVPEAELLRLPAIPKRGSEGDAILRMIMLNEQRFTDTISNKARKAAAALDRGKTEEEVCSALGVSKASLKNLLAYIDAPAVVRHAADAGKITMSDAYKLSRLEPSEAREKLTKLLEHAPRTPGKKRSSNAKKAREILDGSPKKVDGAGLRESHIVENLKRELEERDSRGELVVGAVAALAWVLGDESALKILGFE